MMGDYKIALLLRRIVEELKPYATSKDLSHREGPKPDFIEVGRTAHELVNRHGQNACQYAARLATEAVPEGKADEAAFWKAVAEWLEPRGSQLAHIDIARLDPHGFSSRPKGQCKDSDYVRSWCQILTQYAEMFESNQSDITEQRREEIHSIIFGGMGSFSDFGLDTQVFGNRAGEANNRLQALRTELYSVFTVRP